VGIGCQVQAGGPPFDARQRDLLDRIEADCADTDRLVHRERDDLHRYRLQQAQDLDELALALVAHTRLKEVTHMLERLRKGPVLQRGGLIECIGLGLDQRQIMQRVRHKHGLTITARMSGDLLIAT